MIRAIDRRFSPLQIAHLETLALDRGARAWEERSERHGQRVVIEETTERGTLQRAWTSYQAAEGYLAR